MTPSGSIQSLNEEFLRGLRTKLSLVNQKLSRCSSASQLWGPQSVQSSTECSRLGHEFGASHTAARAGRDARVCLISCLALPLVPPSSPPARFGQTVGVVRKSANTVATHFRCSKRRCWQDDVVPRGSYLRSVFVSNSSDPAIFQRETIHARHGFCACFIK